MVRSRLAALALSTAGVACSLIILAGGATPTPALAADPAVVGQWDAPRRWPSVAVHLIMLPTGRVLFFRGDGSTPKTYTWDPATEEIQQPSYPGDNIFCSAHSFLSDGRVLVTGGDTGSTGSRNRTLIFDPLTSQWSRGPNMRRGRYYPTTVSLGDGRVVVFSGKDEDGKIVDLVEVYVVGGGPGGSDQWNLLPGASRAMNYYPRMQLLPSGLIFHVGEAPTTEVFDPATESWSIVDTSNYGKRYEGTAVMLPPGHERIMIVGGGPTSGTPTATAEIIDMSEAAPAWRYTNPMRFRRAHLNAVVLPDGKVMVAGGTDDGNPVYSAELFDPAAETWSLIASMATKRGYHSTAVLLPDGRVLWAGANGNPTREVYSPPYLFRGARPVIDAAPSSVEYGETFRVQTPDALGIASVVLIRPGSATHAANMEQRYIPLAFVPADPGTLDVVAPTEPNVAPPGYYMLFILDGDGIPSAAPFVLLRSTTGAPPPTSSTMPPPSSTTSSSSSTTTTTAAPTTTTLRPGCGDGRVNTSAEECDGADDAACPGACQADCGCAGLGPRAAVEADVGLRSQDPDQALGQSAFLWADRDSPKRSLLRVRVRGVDGAVLQSVRLNLRVGADTAAASASGGYVRVMSACDWDESALTWRTQPPVDGPILATAGAVTRGQVVPFDLTAAVPGDGVYCFALESASSDGVIYSAREAGSAGPSLSLAVVVSRTTTSTLVSPSSTTTAAPTTTTLLPGCGDGRVNTSGEECDGSDDAACPGACQVDCGCAGLGPRAAVEADVGVLSREPDRALGTGAALWADKDSAKRSFLRVRVRGVDGAVLRSVRLALRVATEEWAESASGGYVRSMSACTWDERTVTWRSQPPVDGPILATAGPAIRGQTIAFDVTSAVPGDGVYCFALDSTSTDQVTYDAREAGPSGPRLELSIAAP